MFYTCLYMSLVCLSPIGKVYVWEYQLEMRHKLIYSTYHDNQEQEHTTLASLKHQPNYSNS